MRLRLLALVGALACPACGAAPPPTTPAAGGTPRWHEAPTRPAPPPPRRATRTSRPAAPPPRAAEPEPTPAEPTFLQPLVDPARTRAVVLLYHAFDVGPDPLSVSSTNLERQICWLLDSGVEIIGLGQLVDFLEGRCRLPRRVAVITIDDGLRSTYTRAWPILERHGARFTLGLSTRLIEHPGRHPVMSWDQVRELTASGLCEIASHGHAHRRLVGIADAAAHEELVLSRQIIERETGLRPLAYFYPLGAVDEHAARRVRKAGYRAGFTATGDPVALGSSPMWQLPRTSIVHSDGLGRFSWYFGPQFLQRLPPGWAPEPRVNPSETTPLAAAPPAPAPAPVPVPVPAAG